MSWFLINISYLYSCQWPFKVNFNFTNTVITKHIRIQNVKIIFTCSCPGASI
jgi:hypothetical protein